MPTKERVPIDVYLIKWTELGIPDYNHLDKHDRLLILATSPEEAVTRWRERIKPKDTFDVVFDSCECVGNLAIKEGFIDNMECVFK